jgi:Protein of unknown function (DUF5663)
MLRIDNSLLEELGLYGLPPDTANSLLHHVYETLEARVGTELANQMTNEQLDEFEAYTDAKDKTGAFRWIETNFPNYKEIVNRQFEALKVEIRTNASAIMASAKV